MTETAKPGGGFCRDCLSNSENRTRCPQCSSPRILQHRELHDLAIAHMDCDAFFAAVEKRDNPELQDRPVIIGGPGRRGVVATACYIARINGVRSAMPIYKARKLCPEAVIIKPQMAKYTAVGRQIRTMMRQLTPLVEPLSIDEAFLDLSGTSMLHAMSPAQSMAHLALQIESEIGITVSVGLSHNKFLAKLASDMNKPRGFSIIGKAETHEFLKKQPVSLIWGVGKTLQARLARDGIKQIGQLQNMNKSVLAKAYGQMGMRLFHLSRGEDNREVNPVSPTKSIGRETTFDHDISDYAELEAIIWLLCEHIARQANKAGLSGRTVTLKLKTGSFKNITRSKTLDEPTRHAEIIFSTVQPALKKQAKGISYRLIGVTISNLVAGKGGNPADLLDPQLTKRIDAELAINDLRERFGEKAVIKGRGLKS